VSADSLLYRQDQLDRSGPRRRWAEPGRDARGRPVDHLDVAARLESSGFGDLAAVDEGSPDVFAYAAGFDLAPARRERLRETPPPPAARSAEATTSRWAEATSRSVLILGGALTFSAAGAGGGIRSETLLVAGVAGWVAGQLCGAPTWRRRGLGDRAGAARVGSWLAVLAVGLAVVGAIIGHAADLVVSGPAAVALADTGTVVTWVVYAVAAALLGVLGNLSRVAGVAVITAVVGVVGLAIAEHALAVGAAAVLLAMTVEQARRAASAGGRQGLARPDRADVVSARNGAGQAVGLAACLLGLLVLVPGPLRAPVTVAAMAASTLSEPMLVGLGAIFGSLARRATTWRRVRWTVAMVTLAGLVVLAAATVGLALLMAAWLVTSAPHAQQHAAAAAAGAVSVVNGGCALAQRAGRDRAAMSAAVGCGIAVVVTAWWLPSPLAVVLMIGSVVATMTLVAVRAAWQPVNW
jgi:hypothetical protein